jgi:hypothetical protein
VRSGDYAVTSEGNVLFTRILEVRRRPLNVLVFPVTNDWRAPHSYELRRRALDRGDLVRVEQLNDEIMEYLKRDPPY